MDIIIKIAILILFFFFFLFTLIIAIYALFDHIRQGNYIISFLAVMTIIFIVTFLIQFIKVVFKYG
jgi:hypothetical protein